MNLMRYWNKTPLWEKPGEPSPAPAANAPAPEPTPDPAPEPAPVADPAPTGPDLSFLPEQFRSGDEPDLAGFATHYQDLAAEKAIRDEAAATVPEDAKGYEFAVPDEVDFGELDLPDDFKVELKADSPEMAPIFEGLGSLLHSLGAPKEATGKVMGLLAQYEAAKYAPSYAAAKAEMTQLGTAAEARIARVNHAVETALSAPEAAAIKAATSTADGVRALEKLLLGKSTAIKDPVPPGDNDDNAALRARYNKSS